MFYLFQKWAFPTRGPQRLLGHGVRAGAAAVSPTAVRACELTQPEGGEQKQFPRVPIKSGVLCSPPICGCRREPGWKCLKNFERLSTAEQIRHGLGVVPGWLRLSTPVQADGVPWFWLRKCRGRPVDCKVRVVRAVTVATTLPPTSFAVALEGDPTRRKPRERRRVKQDQTPNMAFSGFKFRQLFSAILNPPPWILLLPGKKLEYFQD